MIHTFGRFEPETGVSAAWHARAIMININIPDLELHSETSGFQKALKFTLVNEHKLKGCGGSFGTL